MLKPERDAPMCLVPASNCALAPVKIVTSNAATAISFFIVCYCFLFCFCSCSLWGVSLRFSFIRFIHQTAAIMITAPAITDRLRGEKPTLRIKNSYTKNTMAYNAISAGSHTLLGVFLICKPYVVWSKFKKKFSPRA